MSTTEPETPLWTIVAALVAVCLLFSLWWLLIGFIHSLGTCGEDSEVTAEEYARLCEGGGSINSQLNMIGGAAALLVAGLGGAALWRRSWLWIGLLSAGLLLAAIGCYLIVSRS